MRTLKPFWLERRLTIGMPAEQVDAVAAACVRRGDVARRIRAGKFAEGHAATFGVGVGQEVIGEVISKPSRRRWCRSNFVPPGDFLEPRPLRRP